MLRRFRELYRFREMLYMLVYRDLKARSKQAVFGYFWIIVQPLLATGFFTVLVQGVLGLKLSGDIPYPVFLVSTLIFWQYFSNALTASMESLVGDVDLLTRVYFPKDVLVLYPIVTKLLDLAIGMIVLGLFMVIFKVAVHWTVVVLPLFILMEMLFAYALGLLLAPLSVAFRDVSRAVSILLSFAVYAVPVLYPLEKVPQQFIWAYMLNPMAVVLDGSRRAILYGTLPDPQYLTLTFVTVVALVLVTQRIFQVFERVVADLV